MRASIQAPLFFSLAAWALVSVACSGSSRDTLSSTKKDPAKPTSSGPSTEDPGGPGPDFVGDARPDAGPDMEEVCAPDPSRYEVPGNNCDDDGDGTVDNVAAACDASLQVTGVAEDFAKSLGLCQTIQKASDPKWGLISAKYTKGYNQTAAPPAGQHGILKSFGSVVKPREGDAFGVLSTGWARAYDSDNGPQNAFKAGSGLAPFSLLGGPLPAGYPKSSGNCPTIGGAWDIAVVHLEIKTPANAQGFQFDFNFYSGEWPEWVCSPFNDGFIAYLKSQAFNNGAPDNVSFDSKGAPVSVNNAFFDRCTPNSKVGCATGGSATAACPGGESELAGTGFEDRGTYCGGKQTTGGGATGWLTSQAPVKGGETITLEFYIWNSGDDSYNSSVLLDNFRWVPKPVVAQTTRPPPK
jgi:hypothetical protein